MTQVALIGKPQFPISLGSGALDPNRILRNLPDLRVTIGKDARFWRVSGDDW